MADPDDALRTAIKTALDAGSYARVRALLDVLESTETRVAGVVELATRRIDSR